jgi:hypothetical protein
LTLQEEIAGEDAPLRLSHDRVLEALRRLSDGNAQGVVDELSQVYEDILEGVSVTNDLPTEAVATQILEKEFLKHFAFEKKEDWAPKQEAAYRDDMDKNATLCSIDDFKGLVTQWVHDNKPYFQSAYLSWLLTILRLLIDFADETLRSSGDRNLFKVFYFNFSKAVTLTAGRPAVLFPDDSAEMSSILEREEGVTLEKFAREKCLTYFERLFDIPLRLSRRRLIEFYFMTKLNHLNKAELDLILTRHRFQCLGADDLLIVRCCDIGKTSPTPTRDDFIDLLVESRNTLGQKLGKGRRAMAFHWPITEKLFRWKYPRFDNERPVS